MPCQVCGSLKTIKAHLIPRSMCTEVQVGKSHAITNFDGQFKSYQSGLWDNGILCEEHDGKLGQYEETALKIFQEIRSEASGKFSGSYEISGASSDSLLKFYSAILYKYAITKKGFGRIDLGPFLEPIRDYLFFNAAPPKFLDALLIRPKLHATDADVFAYRAPKLDRKFGRNIYRMMLGGVIAFVLIDNYPLTISQKLGNWIKEMIVPRYIIQPAHKFEEFKIPQAMLRENGRLSDYLESQEGM